ncbi:phage holin family protein [Actinotalea sp. AC32]|nr:phage holin family protein [Actinotalea sp. AC32]
MTSTRRTFGREERPSIGELVSQLSEKTSRLVRDEIQLAKSELATKAKHAGVGIGLFAGAAFLGFFGFAALITTAILGLSNAVSPWLAALIVAVVLLVLAAVLGLLGKKALDRGVPPTPDRAQENVKLDVQAVKEGLR